MSLTVCVAPANTVAYPNGGGHLWVYLHWALALKALGCRVIWLEGLDVDDNDTSPAGRRRRRGGAASDCVAALKARLASFGLADPLALYAFGGGTVPDGVAQGFLDLNAAAEADLLLNLWHSAPAGVVGRFRRTAFIDTDPGLPQIWMTTGAVQLARHDLHFTIGETVGTPAARFPDGGRTWVHTVPPVYLPEWPCVPEALGGAAPPPYTTVAHWWGGTLEFNAITFRKEKRASFLEYQDLPHRTPVSLELAVCLAEFHEEYRRLLEPMGWRLREAWDVTATPDAYRTYVQRSRGEFSCAKTAYISLETAWVSDRTLCYLASGKPAVVQYTGASRFLPDAQGLFRFRNMDEAVRALATAEADYERHGRAARALVEEHFDARRVVASVLERALGPPACWPRGGCQPSGWSTPARGCLARWPTRAAKSCGTSTRTWATIPSPPGPHGSWWRSPRDKSRSYTRAPRATACCRTSAASATAWASSTSRPTCATRSPRSRRSSARASSPRRRTPGSRSDCSPACGRCSRTRRAGPPSSSAPPVRTRCCTAISGRSTCS